MGYAEAQRFWQARTARERLALILGLTLALALAGYGWLWRPMLADLARLTEQLPRLRAQAAQLQQAGDEIARLRAQAPGGALARDQLEALLARSAAAHQIAGLTLAVDPATQRVKLTLARTRFDAWLAWTDELHRSHRVVLASVRIAALDAPGMVRVEAEFALAAERK